MTRHNLASHISWLLSSEVTPPVGVHTSLLNPSTSVVEIGREALAEDNRGQHILRSSTNSRAAQTSNTAQEFACPAAPPPNPPQAHVRENTTRAGEDSMGKLASASRSIRPALISQHQLPTPVSTTSSSLTQGYATFLRANNGKFKTSVQF